MKPALMTISAALLAGGLGAGAANALPRLDAHVAGAVATTPARLVCNYHRCFHTYYRGYYYRPYGYYRPYYYAPHVGIGIGPFGVGIF